MNAQRIICDRMAGATHSCRKYRDILANPAKSYNKIGMATNHSLILELP